MAQQIGGTCSQAPKPKCSIQNHVMEEEHQFPQVFYEHFMQHIHTHTLNFFQRVSAIEKITTYNLIYYSQLECQNSIKQKKTSKIVFKKWRLLDMVTQAYNPSTLS